MPRVLVFGKSGWIGGLLGEFLEQQGIPFEYASARLEDRMAIQAELDRFQPTHVFNAAGVTGRPNVDWCETHRHETIRSNVLGCTMLADVCFQRGIHMTYYGTGCIYTYDEAHPEGSGKGFQEEDPPNFTGSFYSATKVMVEGLLKEYPNVLILRMRMPIVKDLTHPRNFITKLIRYSKIVNIPNSVTVLPELLPVSIDMALRKNLTGIVNLVNPDPISHNEILHMVKTHVPAYRDLTWTNFTVEEQAAVIAVPRSNTHLDTTRLQTEYPEVLPIRQSLLTYVFQRNPVTQ